MTDLRRYQIVIGLTLLALTGCPQPAPPPPSPSGTVETPLRVMVVDDPPLAAALAREWLAHTEKKIDLVEVTTAKAAAAEQLPVDVVICPPKLLGQFATRDLLLPLEESALTDPAYERDEILPALKDVETTWGRRTVAVPLGSPQLALWYRADLLPAGTQPPRTWEEYAALVEKFEKEPGELKQITAEPLADGWAARLLLARAAAGALHRDQLSPLWNLETMEPLIANPPFVRALEQLAKDNRGAGERKLLSPVECYEKFQAGECLFALGWPGQSVDGKSTTLADKQYGVTQLPGSREMFQPTSAKWEGVENSETIHVPFLSASGRVAAVTRASAQPKIATQFILWLSGPTVSGRAAAESRATTVFRKSHLLGSWQAPAELRQPLTMYGEVLFAQPLAGRRFALPRIPGSDEYLAALDRAVLATVKEEKPAQEALQTAAKEWQAITAARGLAKQQRTLRSSLGLGD
ncbi:ABC transporter substrate-binding protein [Anatilimnocola floriformis]|uniref:ABC transporter substrate-binding protein n=1 Tax=Anatilimnocola floriformis TaxID=2948575 RepID=UPI0020C50FF4|nr:extracellular solute-binding protein [Anatilimnocola floriformis]